MKILILVGSNGAIGRGILKKSVNFFEKIIAIDKIIPEKKLNKKIDYFKINLLDDNLGSIIIEKLKPYKKDSFTIIFAQRPYLDLNPNSIKDDVFKALKISLISSLDIIENIRKILD